MKTKLTKVFMQVMAVIIALTCIPVVNANAAAKDWAGSDCVKYARARFQEYWGFELHYPNGNARAYYYNAASFGDTISSTPKVGALAVWDSDYNDCGHVAFVEQVNGNQVTVSEGGFNGHYNVSTTNTSSMSRSWYDEKLGRTVHQPFLGYVYVKGTNGHNPQGCVDNIIGKEGGIQVQGWVFDLDSSETPISIHVYIGGSCETIGARGYQIVANKSRPDVDNVYKVGANHGFDDFIATDLRGNQEVYLYAINVGGGVNIELGHKTVYISNSHTHSYTSTITKAATCTSTGVKTYKCSCGNSYTETIPVTSHNYEKIRSGEYLSITTYTCKTCKYSYTEDLGVKSAKVTLGSNSDLVVDIEMNDTSKIDTIDNSILIATIVSDIYPNGRYGFAEAIKYKEEKQNKHIIIHSKFADSAIRNMFGDYHKLSIGLTTKAGSSTSILSDKFYMPSGEYIYLKVGESKNLAEITGIGISNLNAYKLRDFDTEIIDYDKTSYNGICTGKKTGRTTFLLMNNKTGEMRGCTFVVECKEHTYDNGKITTAATSTSTGIKTYTCTACGATKTEVIPKTAPAKVTGITSTATSSDITLKWSAVSGATGYRVSKYNPSTDKYEKVADVNATTYKVTGLKASTSYNFKVRAYTNTNNSTLWGANSDIYTVKTSAESNKPAQVTGLKSTAKTDSTVTLSWSKASGAQKYYIFTYNSSTKKYTEIGSTTSTTLKATKLKASTNYQFAVQAAKTVNKKEYYGKVSSLLTVKTNAASNKPAQVTGLKTTAKTDSTVTLTWSKASGAQKYYIFTYNSSTKKYTEIGSTTSTTFKATKLKANTSYKFAVQAAKTVNKKEYYGTVSSLLTAKTNAASNKPAKVTGLKSTAKTSSTVTLTWSKASGAQKYYIFIYNPSTKKYKEIGSTTKTTFKATKLKSKTNYQFAVQAARTVNKKEYYGTVSSRLSVKTK
ncbi:MAG: fibronectin type III domain-containing protein [Ruminococcus sp.]|nr:fibronectin type III domain-containing protein [Ruminococcus sp.]